MLKDTDLDNLRNTETFHNLVYHLKSLAAEPIKQEEPEEETEPELEPEPELVPIQPDMEPEETESESEPELTPVLEPLKTPLQEKWANQIAYVREMGFMHAEDLVISVLEVNQGNLIETIESLLYN